MKLRHKAMRAGRGAIGRDATGVTGYQELHSILMQMEDGNQEMVHACGCL